MLTESKIRYIRRVDYTSLVGRIREAIAAGPGHIFYDPDPSITVSHSWFRMGITHIADSDDAQFLSDMGINMVFFKRTTDGKYIAGCALDAAANKYIHAPANTVYDVIKSVRDQYTISSVLDA